MYMPTHVHVNTTSHAHTHTKKKVTWNLFVLSCNLSNLGPTFHLIRLANNMRDQSPEKTSFPVESLWLIVTEKAD